MKFIFVSGGVVSGLGKGITTSSLALLLKSRGYKVTPVKIDMYLNLDAGTIRPQEHGEVFVTHDGIETDEDLGHYERFLHQNLTRENYITTGQIYQEVIRKERAFEYKGEDVEAIPHVTDEIIRRIKLAGTTHNAQIVLIELGGTVGEYQNGIFFEANRILKLSTPKDVIHLHVTYLPFLANIGELKSKPAQTSVHILNGMGIQPDIIVARSDSPIDQRRLDRLALFCNTEADHIFPAPNVSTIYQVPFLFHNANRHLATKALKLLSLKSNHHTTINLWQQIAKNGRKNHKQKVKIAIVGKYFATGDYQLADSYVSVVEAVKHASWRLGLTPDLTWMDSERIGKTGAKILEEYDALIVPQGWGSRGTEGKIEAIRFARVHKIPFLGLCFGMQMAVIEFARSVLGIKEANSTETDPDTPHPVIHVMPDQAKYLNLHQYGGTIRLGAYPCKLKKGSLLERVYKEFGKDKEAPWNQARYPKGSDLSPNQSFDKLRIDTELRRTYQGLTPIVFERHRHRYEFNNVYRTKFEKAGLTISGSSPDGQLVEAIELPDHPFFLGVQFHPEYISRPLTPHPLFLEFLKVSAANHQSLISLAPKTRSQ